MIKIAASTKSQKTLSAFPKRSTTTTSKYRIQTTILQVSFLPINKKEKTTLKESQNY